MSDKSIKAIETEYNGYKFRSRLEARWAVFFDELNIVYQYEPEGYEEDGVRYLPDFYLPKENLYVEVKGKSEHIIQDLIKCEWFVKKEKTELLILSEIPFSPESKGCFWFPIMTYSARSGGMVDHTRAFFMKYQDEAAFLQDDFAIGKQYWNIREDLSPEQNYDTIQAINSADYDYGEDKDFFYDTYSEELYPIQQALLKARQARFEHGETPKGTLKGVSQ